MGASLAPSHSDKVHNPKEILDELYDILVKKEEKLARLLCTLQSGSSLFIPFGNTSSGKTKFINKLTGSHNKNNFEYAPTVDVSFKTTQSYHPSLTFLESPGYQFNTLTTMVVNSYSIFRVLSDAATVQFKPILFIEYPLLKPHILDRKKNLLNLCEQFFAIFKNRNQYSLIPSLIVIFTKIPENLNLVDIIQLIADIKVDQKKETNLYILRDFVMGWKNWSNQVMTFKLNMDGDAISEIVRNITHENIRAISIDENITIDLSNEFLLRMNIKDYKVKHWLIEKKEIENFRSHIRLLHFFHVHLKFDFENNINQVSDDVVAYVKSVSFNQDDLQKLLEEVKKNHENGRNGTLATKYIKTRKLLKRIDRIREFLLEQDRIDTVDQLHSWIVTQIEKFGNQCVNSHNYSKIGTFITATEFIIDKFIPLKAEITNIRQEKYNQLIRLLNIDAKSIQTLISQQNPNLINRIICDYNSLEKSCKNIGGELPIENLQKSIIDYATNQFNTVKNEVIEFLNEFTITGVSENYDVYLQKYAFIKAIGELLIRINKFDSQINTWENDITTNLRTNCLTIIVSFKNRRNFLEGDLIYTEKKIKTLKKLITFDQIWFDRHFYQDYQRDIMTIISSIDTRTYKSNEYTITLSDVDPDAIMERIDIFLLLDDSFEKKKRELKDNLVLCVNEYSRIIKLLLENRKIESAVKHFNEFINNRDKIAFFNIVIDEYNEVYTEIDDLLKGSVNAIRSTDLDSIFQDPFSLDFGLIKGLLKRIKYLAPLAKLFKIDIGTVKSKMDTKFKFVLGTLEASYLGLNNNNNNTNNTNHHEKFPEILNLLNIAQKVQIIGRKYDLNKAKHIYSALIDNIKIKMDNLEKQFNECVREKNIESLKKYLVQFDSAFTHLQYHLQEFLTQLRTNCHKKYDELVGKSNDSITTSIGKLCCGLETDCKELVRDLNVLYASKSTYYFRLYQDLLFALGQRMKYYKDIIHNFSFTHANFDDVVFKFKNLLNNIGEFAKNCDMFLIQVKHHIRVTEGEPLLITEDFNFTAQLNNLSICMDEKIISELSRIPLLSIEQKYYEIDLRNYDKIQNFKKLTQYNKRLTKTNVYFEKYEKSEKALFSEISTLLSSREFIEKNTQNICLFFFNITEYENKDYNRSNHLKIYKEQLMKKFTISLKLLDIVDQEKIVILSKLYDKLFHPELENIVKNLISNIKNTRSEKMEKFIELCETCNPHKINRFLEDEKNDLEIYLVVLRKKIKTFFVPINDIKLSNLSLCFNSLGFLLNLEENIQFDLHISERLAQYRSSILHFTKINCPEILSKVCSSARLISIILKDERLQTEDIFELFKLLDRAQSLFPSEDGTVADKRIVPINSKNHPLEIPPIIWPLNTDFMLALLLINILFIALLVR